MKLQKKKQLMQKRRWRIRKKVSGTPERPRLAVRFTHQHIHAQCVDDLSGNTLSYLSTVSKDAKGHLPNVNGATAFGKLFGEKIKGAGIEKIVFDRSGRKYHGRVKAFADAVRDNGIEF
jgi:large subunit ribosomal protein L18